MRVPDDVFSLVVRSWEWNEYEPRTWACQGSLYDGRVFLFGFRGETARLSLAASVRDLLHDFSSGTQPAVTRAYPHGRGRFTRNDLRSVLVDLLADPAIAL